MSKLIDLIDYDEAWPVRFQDEGSAIQVALGPAVVELHHVGSTAVPGLCAKPIIDIAIELKTFPPNEVVIETLSDLGYEHMGESSVPGRHWFAKGSPRSFHVHATATGGKVTRAQVAFRDWLCSHPDGAEAYAMLKREAADGQTVDSGEYAGAKSDFIRYALAEWSGDKNR